MSGTGPEIETHRLRLRMFTIEDAEAFHQLWHDPEVMKYIDPSSNPTLEEARAAMSRHLARWREQGFGLWVVVLKEDAQVIGYCGFMRLEETPEVELLYGIAKAYWNTGLTTEASRACLRYIFENTKLDRIVAVARPQNAGSYRVMEKVGMKYEKNAHHYGNDMVYYSISRADYQPDDATYILREQ
jgi:RimJ/RimL family protein N-acetyltransferase